MKDIEVMIVDDHQIFRDGLKELLEKQTGISVVGDAGVAVDFWKILETIHPDVILMDIDMGEESGINLTKEVKSKIPEIKVLAFSMHGEKNYIMKMMEAGATGYILKNAGKEEMITAIKTVFQGGTYLSGSVSSTLLQHVSNSKPSRTLSNEELPLTRREMEVLKMIAEEYSNAEIADQLFISVRTVDTHRRNLLEKLGVKNTAGLVKYAFKNKLLE